MARLRYKGEKERPRMVNVVGDLLEIRIPLQDGTKLILKPGSGGEFPKGQDIGHEITDARVIRFLEADERYERIS